MGLAKDNVYLSSSRSVFYKESKCILRWDVVSYDGLIFFSELKRDTSVYFKNLPLGVECDGHLMA